MRQKRSGLICHPKLLLHTQTRQDKFTHREKLHRVSKQDRKSVITSNLTARKNAIQIPTMMTRYRFIMYVSEGTPWKALERGGYSLVKAGAATKVR